MNDIKNYAVTVTELRKVGACGYPLETLMVPCNLVLQAVKICEEANKILLSENDRWSKELEKAKNENDRLRKLHP